MTASIKKIAAIILVAIVFFNNSFAQQMYAHASLKTSEANRTVYADENNNTKIDEVTNPLITTKFSALFPNATNLKWTASTDNFWVTFLNNGRKANASFTLKGKLNYIITDCAMENLPGAFSKTITNEYASYHLFNAREIKAYGSVVYQAILEDSKGYITLKYTSEGVEQIQQVKKQ